MGWRSAAPKSGIVAGPIHWAGLRLLDRLRGRRRALRRTQGARGTRAATRREARGISRLVGSLGSVRWITTRGTAFPDDSVSRKSRSGGTLATLSRSPRRRSFCLRSGHELATLEADLKTSQTLIDLATRLGRACLSDQGLLEKNLEKPTIKRSVERLGKLVARTNPQAWQRAPRGGYEALLASTSIQQLLSDLASLDPVRHLAVLRGLCPGALDLFFDQFRGRLELSPGVPIPNATRPVQLIFKDDTTPYQQSITARLLLYNTGFDLFTDVDPSITVTIDFSHRDRLDAITWPSNRFPRIGAIHSRLDKGRLDYRVVNRRVFDVGPKKWSLAQTRKSLKAVKDAEIAILPELSLPSPKALERELIANPTSYSPMVVAGSAHARLKAGGKPLRVNESRVYIDGVLALRHRKIRPLETRTIGPKRFEHPIRENLQPPQKQLTLLSGEKTRMAVVICSDLIDRGIPRVLEECGVNLLLVPSLTYKTGSFNGDVCKLASTCQALGVVVNPILDRVGSRASLPFTMLAAVPNSRANQQSHEYFLPKGQKAIHAVLDPNQPLDVDAALRWG